MSIHNERNKAMFLKLDIKKNKINEKPYIKKISVENDNSNELENPWITLKNEYEKNLPDDPDIINYESRICGIIGALFTKEITNEQTGKSETVEIPTANLVEILEKVITLYTQLSIGNKNLNDKITKLESEIEKYEMIYGKLKKGKRVYKQKIWREKVKNKPPQ